MNETTDEPRQSGIIIPIYEYSCQGCGHHFEALIRGEEKAACPKCASADLEREFSLPALKTSSTHGKAMKAAKKRDLKQGTERAHVQREYELHHDDH